ncbi:hypothetical protein N7478_009662 [Penicillium angulare]|uniref:uncharacterized protein n=1 Tax=Penicillium angulare TaxID=116970 RepID=UPI0025409FC8|nr:uncharacterized protein N7478_009662 [Penicillium angulare]KAJ5266854.1 hypothetical protein N7478_009662 [Penicillium angulare]
MSSSSLPTINGHATPTFDIFSSLRYDPELLKLASQHPEHFPEPLNSPYYLLAHHQDRLINAARYFEWKLAFEEGPAWMNGDLNSLQEFLDSRIPDRHRPWRLKLVVHRSGHVWCEIAEAGPIDPLNFMIPGSGPRSDPSPWRVYLDSKATFPSGFTAHKTTARDDYTDARLRSGITTATQTDEVLIVNNNGEVMEGSITTPYFRQRGGSSWITPPLKCGGNAGTTRRYALAQGFCTEQVITASELVDGEECWLSNGVRGFIRGVVVLK